MHGQIDASFAERALDLLHKHPIATDLRQGQVGDAIAGRVNMFDLYIKIGPVLM